MQQSRYSCQTIEHVEHTITFRDVLQYIADIVVFYDINNEYSYIL